MREELNKSGCGISIELLSAFIDNELDEQEYARIKEHLESCVYCRKIVEQFKEMDEQIRQLELEEPSREFIFNLKRNVMERIGKKPKFVFWKFFPILIPAAVAVLILIVIRSEGLETPVGMNNRVPYVYSDEEKAIKDQKIDISLPAPAPIAKSKPRTETHLDKKTTAPAPTIASRQAEELESRAYAAEQSVPEISEQVVIRAIVDSTGRIINVAKGKSLTPEEDTTIFRALKGKQLSPPKIQGRPTQMFVEFTPEEKDSN
ncbi:MAG: zf-HC2 domain-containing protein [candidate division WOR-3 bacterium]